MNADLVDRIRRALRGRAEQNERTAEAHPDREVRLVAAARAVAYTNALADFERAIEEWRAVARVTNMRSPERCDVHGLFEGQPVEGIYRSTCPSCENARSDNRCGDRWGALVCTLAAGHPGSVLHECADTSRPPGAGVIRW
ncbi:MAG TPA: hypothetical protein VE261_01390 [Gaiellaceae bacterium]|jgi:hypothetical protein|nr:hypothetical protein [Gaiellaceae bacterium]